MAALGAVLSLMAFGCGESSTRSAGPEPAKPIDPATLTKPEVRPPDDPNPEELVIEELKQGTGPEAEPGDLMTIQYLSFDENGKEEFVSWGASGPITFELGAGKFFQGWDEGLEGMKVGGRREIAFPSDLTDGLGDMFYVIDLLEIK